MNASLDLIREEARHERDAQLRHLESLDSKAGLMLGFAGVLVALGPAAGRFGMAGKMFAVAAAGWAVSAFFPRTHPMSDLETMHRDYPMWDERLTKRLLLNASVKAVYEARWSLQQRVARLQISIGFGALSVLMLVWDILRA